MASNQNPNDNSDGDIAPSMPQWRSVQVGSRQPQLVPQAASVPKSAPGNDDVIDKASFFRAREPEVEKQNKPKCPWVCPNLRPVPAFYPLEKSSRFVDDDTDTVTERLAECLRVLSVQAVFNNEAASAYLMTSEGVEMHLSLWKTTGEKSGIVVELQRRKGDSIAFHRYSRYILDAAIGDFDVTQHLATQGVDMDLVYSKKVQRLLNVELQGKSKDTEHENAVIAIEIAHGLLMKDRMDARQLGLESLCLLTDPKKTGITTALIASHVVLLGTARGIQGLSKGADLGDDIIFDEAPFQGIREAILSLVQFSRIGEDVEFENEEEDAETMGALHNLALAVLANALDVVENQDRFDDNPEETEKKPSAIKTAPCSEIAGAFLDESGEISKAEIMKTLISELGKASKKPHNACLSARCIGSLCRASDKAKRRAKELGAKNVVSTALDVGVRTHLKLETECNKVTKVLQAPTREDN
ncbi:expressed unknown protein [Seminavis robusta]|uniref:Uncharacterized protein n=1 Tax=Seminavis robusta TaxID=568900 RepID=A0A9N8GZC7_9STRA|nr:expressed unknown protein [Seminavis robusta]|eukprot:Sro2_g001540.1 n/a (472) ;mRNA; r:183973-185646